jgi:hypothetical protein
VGWDLYGLLGIAKTDKARMQHQHGRNFIFFDAPVGLIFTIDRVMQQGSWLDYGMFLQNIMVAARARGLHTCPQAAFTQFHRIDRRGAELGDEQMLVCGMSLGMPTPMPSRTASSPSAPVAEFARFLELTLRWRSELGLAWGLPFAGLLLSIAVLPLAAPAFWHHHFGKIAAAWALALLLPFVASFGAATGGVLVHTLLEEYRPSPSCWRAVHGGRRHLHPRQPARQPALNAA